MIYLAIFVAVAGAGIGALWLYQRRERKQMSSGDDFCSSLERLSNHHVAVRVTRSERRTSHARPGGSRRPEPLDPVRREAARRRLEHRRAARA